MRLGELKVMWSKAVLIFFYSVKAVGPSARGRACRRACFPSYKLGILSIDNFAEIDSCWDWHN